MDFGKAFTYMFDDPDWLTKLAIGTGSRARSAVVFIAVPHRR